jgi:DNA-binding XRE family transcriptional regulator
MSQAQILIQPTEPAYCFPCHKGTTVWAMSSTVQSENPLRQWRYEHRVTQEALATAMHVHPSVVSQWEMHRSVPTLERFHELHQLTGIGARVLLHFFVPVTVLPFKC